MLSKVRKALALAALGVAGLAAVATPAQASTVTAYAVNAGTVGLQGSWNGTLGLDFDVLQPITISSLGVFDSAQDGLNRTIKVSIYDRDTHQALVTLAFAPGDAATLEGGSLFKDLASALNLAVGFHGSVIAENYGTTEPDGNTNVSSTVKTWNTNDGGGALAFVGHGRWGSVQGVYPNDPPASYNYLPPDVFAAGTFKFEVDAQGGPAAVPTPAAAAAGIAGLLLLVGRKLIRKAR